MMPQEARNLATGKGLAQLGSRRRPASENAGPNRLQLQLNGWNGPRHKHMMYLSTPLARRRLIGPADGLNRLTRRLIRPLVFALLLLSLSMGACSQVSPAPGQSAPKEPIPAHRVNQFPEQLGELVTVRGTIDRTGESRSGYQFLNFANSELTAVCYPQHVARFPVGKPSEIYRGQQVELSGRLERYQGKLQIRLTKPAQIRVVASPKTDEHTRSALRKVGTDVWLSPAGLRYKGRDPAGRTRVEHVLRHARDDPQRDGPHGVFDGEAADVFSVIDEAWERAQQQRMRPNREGDRSSYTVPMGRRIGYLGGSSGRAKGHPPRTRVFIVFKTGTREIVTAYPK